MRDFWPACRVMVPRGGGFLGQAIVRRLQAGGADQVLVPRSKECDLRTKEGIGRALADTHDRLLVEEQAAVHLIPPRPPRPTRPARLRDGRLVMAAGGAADRNAFEIPTPQDPEGAT